MEHWPDMCLRHRIAWSLAKTQYQLHHITKWSLVLNGFSNFFLFSLLLSRCLSFIFGISFLMHFRFFTKIILITWSSRPEVLLEKDVLKICSKFTGEHPCRSVISIKVLSNFIKVTLRRGRSPVNLLHIFRTPFSKNTSWWRLLYYFPTRYISKKSNVQLLNNSVVRIYFWS